MLVFQQLLTKFTEQTELTDGQSIHIVNLHNTDSLCVCYAVAPWISSKVAEIIVCYLKIYGIFQHIPYIYMLNNTQSVNCQFLPVSSLENE